MKLKQAIKIIKKDLKKNCLGKPCPEMDMDCANCKFHVFNGFLNWYKELVDWGQKYERKRAMNLHNK